MTMLLLNVVLAVVWLALTGVFTPVNFTIGFVIGFVIMGLTEQVSGKPRYARRLYQAVIFVFYFLWQLILANLRVAYSIVMPQHNMRPAVVALPIDLQTSFQVTLLANLITLTPGTLTLDVAPDERTLYVHAMHVYDVDEFKQEIKDGFEYYVKEIF